jgi:Protein of unknown function (DUF3048) N-terminal domain/Protein of unknown function (DUF3048) C-terminal domain
MTEMTDRLVAGQFPDSRHNCLREVQAAHSAYGASRRGRDRAMTLARHKTLIAVAAAVLLAGLLAGSYIALRHDRQVTGAAAPSPSPSTVAQLRSPFTGEPVPSLNRVLAVKIDNIVNARPQTGLARADIVYVLPVEGGLSRLMAIFSSRYPPVVGPVRSAREDDLQLLRQFGRPAFAYSGATPRLLPYIHRTARIVDLYAGRTSGYYRDLSRIAPYNLYARTRQLLAQAPGASTAHDIGFQFGPPPAGGNVTRSVSVSYPSASFRFTWSAPKGRWLVSMDGTRAVTAGGVRLSAATVVIQHTTVRTSRFKEYGFRPPFAESTGSGTTLVLRDGRAWAGHWSRSTANGGTTFTTASGRPMTFARGQVWVVLTRR